MAEDIVNEDTKRVLGRDAQRNNILAARVMAETVKTTLGPKGMDKMLVDRAGNITITNDGVTILSEMEVEHPAAKMLVEIAQTQEDLVGDGTTTAVMLAGKLLENAESLLDKSVHPTVITRGYRWASDKAIEILEKCSLEINSEEELGKVAQTAMTGKGAEHLKETFSKIVVEAVKILAEEGPVTIHDIAIEKQKGKSLEDTTLVKGVILNAERASHDMPKKVEQAKIALIDEGLEMQKPETQSRISIQTPTQLQSFLMQEEEILKEKVQTLKEAGATAVFASKGIDDSVKFYLAKEGIYACRRITEKDLKQLARATGARILSKLSEITEGDLGFAQEIQEVRIGEETFTHITGCKNPKALTILVRGGTDHVIDETARALQDAIGDVATTLTDSKVVAGGGAIEMELSKQLLEFAKTVSGREKLAVIAFAHSLECIPLTLAENAGLDSLDTLTELQTAHNTGRQNAGLNLFTQTVENTAEKGILEPLQVKKQALSAASEVAMMILRIDDVVAAKPLKRKSSEVRDYE